MKLEDILSMSSADFKSMSEKALTKVINYMNKIANARIDRLKKNKIENAATRTLDKMGKTKFTLERGSDINKKRNLFMQVRNFLMHKTSTISGQQEYEQNVISGLAKKGIYVKKENKDKLFEIYQKFEDLHNNVMTMKYEILDEIASQIAQNEVDDEKIIQDLNNKYNDMYKQLKGEEMGMVEDFYGEFGSTENIFNSVKKRKQQNIRNNNSIRKTDSVETVFNKVKKTKNKSKKKK